MIRHCIPLLVVVALTGCWGKGEEGVPASGDPEADLRAEQRVGADERGDAEEEKEKARTLYDRLGGHEAISALVEDVTARVIADPRVNFERANVRVNVLGRKYKQWQATEENVAKFKKHMVEFLALAAGGPAEYTGVDMSSAHKGMKVTNNEFDAFVGDMKASMDKLGFSTRNKRDLLAIVETTRKQIVEE